MPISKLLVANRGEIAVRIIRAARELGIPSVQVHSAADADMLAVSLADESVEIGPAPASAKSYLDTDADPSGGPGDGGRCDPPGLRVPRGKRGLRRSRASARD